MNVLHEHPKWQEHEARVEEARKKRSKVAAAAAKSAEDYRQAVAAHKQAIEEAVQNGDPIPQDEPRPSTSNQHAVQYASREIEALYEESKELKAALVPDLEDAARARWLERREALAEAVAVISEATKAVAADARVLSECRAYADSRKDAVPRPHRGERTQIHWDVEDVVHAVQHALDPFALEPIRRPDGTVIESGHGAPESTPPAGYTPSRHRPRGFVPAR